MRILVVGGKGFLGRRTVTALRRIPGAEVSVGSRRGGAGCIEMDILDYSSRTAMDGFDVVVNCADGLEASPEKAAEYCLLQGITFVETSADTEVVSELYRTARAVPEPRGAVVLSAGLFPGLSNLLAAKLVEGRAPPERLEVGIRYSPWSQAGSGVCRLMAEALGRPAVRYESGEQVCDPPVTAGVTIPFGGVERPALGVGLPESSMLHWSMAVPSTASYVAPVPAIPLALQRLITLFTPWGLLRLDAVQWLMGFGFALLRGGLMRWRRAGVAIAAVVDRGVGSQPEASACIVVDKGFVAAVYGIAATVAVVAEHRPAPGVHLVDQVAGLDDVLDRIEDLSRGELRIEVAVPLPPHS